MNKSFFARETDAQYRALSRTHLSSHALADFRRCPLLFHRKRLGLIPDTDSPAFALGRATHCLILEGRNRFMEDYAVGGPINPKTNRPFGPSTQAFLEWASKIGRPVITEEQHFLISQMESSVRSHPIASRLLSQGVAEGVIRLPYNSHPCQGRVDFFTPESFLIDLKTCDDLDFFEGDIRRYGYVFQMAFYQALIGLASGKSPEEITVYLVAVEKQEPFRTGVWLLDSLNLAQARAANEGAMDCLNECERTGVWPTNFEEIRFYQAG